MTMIIDAPSVNYTDNGEGALLVSFTDGSSMIMVITAPPPACEGDGNGDGQVNFLDITAALANWDQVYPENVLGPGDTNDDGMVDFGDISAVLANWKTACE